MRIGILGKGEIGTAISEVYASTTANCVILYKDLKLKLDDDFTDIDVLNVCIPYITEDQFVGDVSKTVTEFKPSLTIIHSSVQPSSTKDEKTTIQKIIDLTSNTRVVHSPVRGVHPHLYDGIKTFVKFIGAETPEAGKLAKEHLDTLGIESLVTTSKNTELTKLLSTSYYGICIAFTEEMGKLCDQSGADFDVVVKQWNETYNDGYIKLDKSNVVRPVLYRLSDDKIGGHCVLPNANLLKRKFKTDIFNPILKYQ